MAKERIETFPIEGFEGVELKRLLGVEVSVAPKSIEELLELGRIFVPLKESYKATHDLFEERRIEITEKVKPIKGWRGLTSEIDDVDLTVYPSVREVKWIKERLKLLPGIVYSIAVKELLTTSVTVPIGYIIPKTGIVLTEERVKEAFKKTLAELGIPELEAEMIISQRVDLKVDEEELERRKIPLPEGAKESKVIWNVRAERLKK